VCEVHAGIYCTPSLVGENVEKLRMRRIVLSSVACPAVLYFTTLSRKRHDFRKKFVDVACVFCVKY
jgi:hypothetical protein